MNPLLRWTQHRRLMIFFLGCAFYALAWGIFLATVSIRPRMPLVNSGVMWWIVLSIFFLLISFWKSHRPKILLALFAVATACLFAEIALRILFPEASLVAYRGTPSVRYHHGLIPNQKMFIGYVGSDPIVLETNEDGLRTHYSREEFKHHKHRILLLGDSFIYGLNVRQELILASKLEEILRERLGDNDVAVITAGVSSSSPFLQKLAYEGFLHDYKPTITLMYLDPTDISDDEGYMTEWQTDAPDKPAGQFYNRGTPRVIYLGAFNERVLKPFLWHHLLLPFNLLFTTKSEKYDWYQFRITMDDGSQADRWFIYKYPLDQTRKYFEQTFENVKSVAQMADEIGSRFTFFPTPRFHHWSDRECPDNFEREGYSNDEPYEFAMFEYFDSVKDSVAFDVHSLLPAFRATDRFPLTFPADPHWNAAGNFFVAEITADYLIEHKYLP